MVDTYKKHRRDQTGSSGASNRWLFAVYIGFFAGVIWGAVRIAEYYFRLTDTVPGFLVEPFFKHKFLVTPWGGAVGWAFFTMFSVIAALVYTAVLYKVKGPWVGLLYGLLWWGILYLMVGPLTGMIPWVYAIGWNTIVTDVCLFSLWGLFIGYSIAVEFTDERDRESGGMLGGLLK